MLALLRVSPFPETLSTAVTVPWAPSGFQQHLTLPDVTQSPGDAICVIDAVFSEDGPCAFPQPAEVIAVPATETSEVVRNLRQRSRELALTRASTPRT
jgi:hypothetical protein